MFGNNPVVATIVIAMIPVVELRGAIPFGSSKEIWGDKALSIVEASCYSFIGSLISSLVIILLLLPIFSLLKKTRAFNRLIILFESKFKKKSDKISEDVSKTKYKELKKWLGVMTFVAIPLPLTGVWTGSAVSVFLEMGFLKSFSAVAVGSLISACIISLLSQTLGEGALFIFYGFVVVLFLLLIFYLIKLLLVSHNKKV